MADKVIVVLSVGRSATSLVSEALSRIIPMGSSGGMFENKDILNLNEEILHEAGGAWDNPPPRWVEDERKFSRLKQKFHEKIKSTLARFASEARSLRNHTYWGWKDPRTALVIDFYHPYLKNPHYIAVFRDPERVAENFHRVNGIEVEVAIKLAREYNRRILEFIEKHHV